MRFAAAAIAVLLALGAAHASEGVRLKNGKFLSGNVLLDDADKDGFKVERWDTGGVVYVRWNQVPEAEKNRLLGRVPLTGPVGVFLDGVRALTESRDVVGVLMREDANQYLIKTSESPAPKPVPKSALLKPLEKLKIPEAEAYSPKEMIDSRVAKADEKSYPSLLEVARFAVGVKEYERAKELYAKAGAADPSKKDEIEALTAAVDALIKEGKAAALLAQVKEKSGKTDYAAAIELAKKLLAEFPESEASKQNAALVANLEKEAKDFEVKKAEILTEKVPMAYKLKRSSLFSEYSRTKYKLSEARTKVTNIDKEVTDALVKDMKNVTPEEIATAWGKREQKPVTVTYGSGSWIVKGGQDGGLDTDAKTNPKGPQQNQNNGGNMLNPFTNRSQNRNQQQQQPKPLGKKLQTSEEWWASASSSERRAWIEAEYANTSSAVNKTADVKKCRDCNGNGTLKGTREGYECEIKCSRCHSVKEDVVLQYW